MTAVDTQTVCETWELTLPEDEAKCEGYAGTCPHPADWMLRISCGCMRLSCDFCKRLTDQIDGLVGHHCGRDVTWTWVKI